VLKDAMFFAFFEVIIVKNIQLDVATVIFIALL